MTGHLSRFQRDSNRRSTRSQGRLTRSRDHSVESLERRELLAAGTFAEFPGNLAAAGEVDSVPLGFEPAEFVLPKNKVTLGFELNAAVGSTLDPGTITLTAASRRNRIKRAAQRIDVAPADNASFLAAQAIPDALTAAVRAEGAGTGDYTLTVFLVGDVNGDFAVTQADLDQITSLIGRRLGDAGYLPEADTNRDGIINKKDGKLAKQNLGVSTTLRPVPPGNRAPVFAPIGPLTVSPGGRIDLELAATDPDGDTVMFMLTSDGLLPTGELDTMGHLMFAPTPEEIGSYQFTLAASDGELETAQNVTLNVVADAVTTTRLSGVLLRTNQQPLAGVMIEVGAVSAITQANGTFLLDFGNAPPVSDTLKVRAELLAGPETFPFIAEKLPLLLEHDVFAGVNNVITRPIFLPALDMANAVQIDPMQDTTVTTAAIPGISLFVEAGTLMNQQGTPFNGLLSITEVPVDLTPAALPDGLFPDLVVTIQPGEMVFTQPAPLTFPNTAGWSPGVLMPLWSINPVTGEFDIVGDMRVSADGSTIDTISGGVRNSSWHFPGPPPPPPPPPGGNNNNNNTDCDECETGGAGGSEILFHTGALTETHDLVTYQSLGQTRGLVLTYDSMRADPRPIVHTGFTDVDPAALVGTLANQLRLIAELRVQRGNFAVTVPGFVGNQFGLDGGENFWTLPAQAGAVDAALQADLRALATGKYDFVLSSGIRLFSQVQQRFVGTAARQTGHILHVNSIDSPFGSGWGLDALEQLVENPDGSVMLVDGDGTELFFEPGTAAVRDFLLPDGANDSILRYDGLTGALKGTFVASGAGGLDAPHNPTFGPDGNLYVFSNANVGAPNPQILRFNGQTGAFIDVFVDSGSGGFTSSAQMAFGPDGNLYVSSLTFGATTSVLRFDGATGAFLGVAASGNGMQRACGIAFGPDGNLYVGDSDTSLVSNYDRVLRFDTAGNFIDVFVPSGNLNNTCPIDFGSDGNLYIADQSPRDIRKFDGATGAFMGVFATSADVGGTPFRATSGIDGNLYVGVAGTPGRIVRVDGTTGDFIDNFVANNTGFGTFFPGPAVLPVRRVQDLLIQDVNNDTVLRYDGITGDLIGQFVGRGAGGLDAPHNPTFGPDGNMYVFSQTPGAQKVLRFNGQTGSFMDVFIDTGEGGFAGSAEMLFGPDGNFYVSFGTVVLRYDSNGNFTGTIGGAGSGLDNACGIEFGPDGNLNVYDTADEEMRRFDPATGNLLNVLIPTSANLVNACDFDIGPSGDIFITDGTLGGVRRFDGATGAFIGVFATTSSTAASGVTFGPDGDLYVNVNGNTDRFDGDTGAFVERFVTGFGGFVNFFPAPPPLGANVYQSPGGDFSTLEKLDDGTFRRTMTDQTVYEYDATGRIVRMTDRNGNESNWEYNAAGNLTRWVDPVGLATTLTYTSGRVTSITDPAGRVTQFEYDATGNLTRITDPDGARRTFEYDADHHMTGEFDQRGNHEQEIYDFAGRIDRTIRKNGAVIDVSPTQVRGLYPADQTDDPFAAPLAVGDLTGESTYIDGNGNATVSTLDGLGQEISSTDPVGALPTTQFDPATNLVTQATDARGNVTNYAYDGRGNLTSRSDSINPANPVVYTYDPDFSQLASMTDELGRQTLFDIDPATGNTRSITRVMGGLGGGDDLVTQFTFTTRGLIDTLTDPLGRVTDYDYDAAGRLTQITFAVGTADEAVSRFEYDAAGNVSASIDENGNRTAFQYDSKNRLMRVTEADPDGAGPLASPVTLFEYDPAGNLVALIDARNNRTRFEYDVLNRATRVIDALDQNSDRSYDNADNLRTGDDPLDHESELVYDGRNRVTELIDPDNGRTQFEYDLDDHITAVTDAVGNTTRFAYDARGRVVNLTDELGNFALYGFDLADNLVAITDRLGRVTEFTYDDTDRLVTEIWVGGGNTIQYAYDLASNLVTLADNFSSLAFVYDARDRVTSVDNLGTPGVPRVVLNYTYDDVGNLLSMTDTIGGAAGGVNNYQYDALNRLIRLTQTGTNVAAKRVDFGYDPLGQFTAINRFADLAGTQSVANTTFAYDALNRLTQLSHAGPGGPLGFFNFSFDAASRITQLVNADGTTDYTHDARDQLTAATHSDAANPDELYAYDSNGNRVTATSLGAALVYQTGPNNRLVSDGRFNFEYDDEGNLTLRTEIATGATRVFTWDFRNRLTAVIERDSLGAELQRVEFTYDAFDRRITKNVVTAGAAVLTHFVHDGANVLLDFIDSDGAAGPNPPALAERYLHGPAVDQVLAQDDGAGGVLWMLTDHLGTVTDLVNSAGAVVNHIKYDSYGNIISESNSAVATRYRFTGRELDTETGLQYHRARYYDPATGRFISEDPIGLTAGDANLYRYTANSPIALTDLSGLKPVTIQGPNGPFIFDPKDIGADNAAAAIQQALQNQAEIQRQNAALEQERIQLEREKAELEAKKCKDQSDTDRLKAILDAIQNIANQLLQNLDALKEIANIVRMIREFLGGLLGGGGGGGGTPGQTGGGSTGSTGSSFGGIDPTAGWGGM